MSVKTALDRSWALLQHRAIDIRIRTMRQILVNYRIDIVTRATTMVDAAPQSLDRIEAKQLQLRLSQLINSACRHMARFYWFQLRQLGNQAEELECKYHIEAVHYNPMVIYDAELTELYTVVRALNEEITRRVLRGIAENAESYSRQISGSLSSNRIWLHIIVIAPTLVDAIFTLRLHYAILLVIYWMYGKEIAVSRQSFCGE